MKKSRKIIISILCIALFATGAIGIISEHNKQTKKVNKTSIKLEECNKDKKGINKKIKELQKQLEEKNNEISGLKTQIEEKDNEINRLKN